ncbi:hypothetical protein [Paenibacillus sp.]|uniref:hypothetical protein n=1 Tax=Paenibacillus sp. TaxID=58172 RepID=UPI0028A8DFDC|nr:hypothetical protein [Paenibacillus sp.]
MNPYILDNSILEELKQAVSDHDNFLISTYCDHNGRNLWNLIFSEGLVICQRERIARQGLSAPFYSIYSKYSERLAALLSVQVSQR